MILPGDMFAKLSGILVSSSQNKQQVEGSRMTIKRVEKNQIRLAIGILISLVTFAVLLWFIDGNEVYSALKKVQLIWIAPILVLLFANIITRSAAWRTILQHRISLRQSFLIVNAGYFVNTILPFRIGEVARAFLLLPSGFSFWEAIPTILLERMFDIIFAVSLFLAALPFALSFPQGIVYATLIAGLVLIGLITLFLLVKNQNRVLIWLENLSLPWDRAQTRLIQGLRSIISGLKILSNPRELATAFGFMFLSWTIGLAYQYLLLKAFIPDAQIFWAVFVLGAVALGVSVPSSPGNIGIYEASITLALSAFGVDRSVAFAYALTSHFLSLMMTTLFGSFALVREGYALQDIWQFSKQHRKDEDR